MFPARSAPAAAPKSARKGGEPISQAPATAAGPSGANPACPAAANRNASAVSSARETPNARRRGSTAARSLCSVSVMIHPSPMRCVRLMIHACPQKGCRTNVIKMRESCNALPDISGYIRIYSEKQSVCGVLHFVVFFYCRPGKPIHRNHFARSPCGASHFIQAK